MVSSEAEMTILGRLMKCDLSGAPLRAYAMELLAGLPGYDWAGIYRLEGDELVLDEFCGEPTEHTRIAVGKGVCGTAVAENRNQIVKDVRAISNYLACSLNTRSEIVVLMRDASGTVVGQVDVDGQAANAFDQSDERLLENVGELLVERWS
jgi:GAF domain-containing protein